MEATYYKSQEDITVNLGNNKCMEDDYQIRFPYY